MFTPVLELRCLSVDELASVFTRVSLCFLSRLFLSGVCQSEAQNTYHVTVGKRNLLHTAPFKALSPINQPFQTPLSVAWGNGAEFDGGLIFSPCTAFYLPKLWIIIITHQVNRQHQCTDCTGQQLRDRECRERDHGKNGFLTGEWQMRWASDALT